MAINQTIYPSTLRHWDNTLKCIPYLRNNHKTQSLVTEAFLLYDFQWPDLFYLIQVKLSI